LFLGIGSTLVCFIVLLSGFPLVVVVAALHFDGGIQCCCFLALLVGFGPFLVYFWRSLTLIELLQGFISGLDEVDPPIFLNSELLLRASDFASCIWVEVVFL
jgi:Zn-dependent protease with chaperone function